MIDVLGPGARLCDGSTRRQILRIGGLGLATGSIGLPALLQAHQARAQEHGLPGPAAAGFGRAKACIVIFLMGGPPQHSTWDPRPTAARLRRFRPVCPVCTSRS